MCGIIGYIGTENAVPIILDGLKRLEYQGYDSSGIAVMNKDGFTVTKQKGRLSELETSKTGNGLYWHWAYPMGYPWRTIRYKFSSPSG